MSYGGIPMPDTVRGFSNCSAYCLAAAPCTAFDMDATNENCYWHDGDTYLQRVRTGTPLVTQFRRLRCSISTVITTAPPCLDTFTRQQNTLAYGASLAAGATTVLACETTCRNDPQCVAFGYNNRANVCWIHTDTDDLDLLNPNTPTMDLYTRVSCITTTTVTTVATTTPDRGCQDTFTQVPGQLSLGGQRSEATGVDACSNVCRASRECLGFDFLTTVSQCYIHTDPTAWDTANVIASSTSDQYRRVDCTITTEVPSTEAPCVDTFQLTEGRLYFGGQDLGVSGNSLACLQACISNVSCVAFDLNTATTRCYFHFDETSLVDLNSVAAPVVNHYLRTAVPRVNGTCTAPTTAGPTTTAPTTVPTTVDVCSGVTCQGCQAGQEILPTVAGACCPTCHDCLDKWAVSTNTLSLGGERIVQNWRDMTLDMCKSMCIANQACLALDYDAAATVRCYHHLSSDTLNQRLNGVTNVDQHLITKRCNEVTTQAPLTTTTTTTTTILTTTPSIDPTPASTAPTTTAQTTTVQTISSCAIDLVFLVDSSGSIEEAGTGNYETLKTFMKNVVTALEIDSSKIRVALLIFSNYAEVMFDFNDHNTQAALHSAIDGISYIGGTTMTSSAFQIYRQQLFDNTNRGNRLNVPDILVTITDGNTTISDRPALSSSIAFIEQQPTTSIAARLAVGIGNIDMNEIRGFVSQWPDNYINVASFGDLQGILARVVTGAQCVAVETTVDPTPEAAVALYAYRNAATDSAQYPVVYTTEALDYQNNFDQDASHVTPDVTCGYWFSISAGVQEFTPVRYMVTGGGATVAVARASERSAGYDTLSKDAILTLNAAGQPNSMAQVNSQYQLYSDENRQTSVAAFSVCDQSDPTNPTYFMAGLTSGEFTGPGQLRFNDYPLDTRAQMSRATSAYTCPEAGIYMLSVGVYMAAGVSLTAELQVDGARWELRRTHAYHVQAGDSLSRTALAYCQQGGQITAYINSGTVDGNSDYSTSLLGFLYRPSVPVAFAVARSTAFENTDQSGRDQDLVFDQRLYATSNINVPTSQVQAVTCTLGGLYYVSLTVQAHPNRRVDAHIAVNGVNQGGILRSIAWHGGYFDTLSRSAIVSCNAGSSISVRVKAGSAVAGSSAADRVGTSLVGILLYRQ